MGEQNEYDVANSGVIDVASKCPELTFFIAAHMHVKVAEDYVYNNLAYSKVTDAKGVVSYWTLANDGITKKSVAEAEYNEAKAKGVLIVEAAKFGEALGKIDLSFENKDGKFKLVSRSSKLMPAIEKAIDPQLGDIFANYDGIAKADARQVVGELKGGDLVPVNEINKIPEGLN